MKRKPAKPAPTPPLSHSEWDFSDLPSYDDKPAFVYEYAREIIRAVVDLKAGVDPQQWRLSLHPAATYWRQALARAFDLGQDPDPKYNPLYTPARWTLADTFPEVPWNDLDEDEKGRVRVSVHPFQTTVAGIFGSHLGLLPLRECTSGTMAKMRGSLPAEFFAVLGGIVSTDKAGLDHGFYALDWTVRISELLAAFDRWLRLEANRRKLAGLPHPPDVSEKKLHEAIQNLPGTRVPKDRLWKEHLRRLGAWRVQRHYRPQELAEYPFTEVQVGALYKHRHDLQKNAKAARGLLARLRARAVGKNR